MFVQGAMDGDDAEPLPIVAGFSPIAFGVNDDSDRYCALLADTDTARAQGMQGMSSLQGYDAMIFRFDHDSTTRFVNHFVPIDLSIGWYDGDGRLVDHTRMQKCPSGENCPLHAARGPFRYAVETPAGGLEDLGLTDSGATLQLGGSCR